MYALQLVPDEKVTLRNGSICTPVVTLKDEYGGVSHIIIDDHCYVLVNGSHERGFATVKHWYREAAEAMQGLPLPTELAKAPSALTLAREMRGYNEQYRCLKAKIVKERVAG